MVTKTIIHAKVRTGLRFSKITLNTTLATVRKYKATKTDIVIYSQGIFKFNPALSIQCLPINFTFVL